LFDRDSCIVYNVTCSSITPPKDSIQIGPPLAFLSLALQECSWIEQTQGVSHLSQKKINFEAFQKREPKEKIHQKQQHVHSIQDGLKILILLGSWPVALLEVASKES
jgi:hypothetical protein